MTAAQCFACTGLETSNVRHSAPLCIIRLARLRLGTWAWTRSNDPIEPISTTVWIMCEHVDIRQGNKKEGHRWLVTLFEMPENPGAIPIMLGECRSPVIKANVASASLTLAEILMICAICFLSRLSQHVVRGRRSAVGHGVGTGRPGLWHVCIQCVVCSGATLGPPHPVILGGGAGGAQNMETRARGH